MGAPLRWWRLRGLCFIKRSRNHKENLSGSWQLHNKSSSPSFARIWCVSISYHSRISAHGVHLFAPILLTLTLSLYLVLFLVQTKKATAMPQTTLFYLFSCGSFGSPSPIFQFSATTGKTFHILNLLAGSFSPFPFPCPRPYPHPPFHAAYLFPRLLLQSILLLCLCFTCSSVLFGIFTKFLH